MSNRNYAQYRNSPKLVQWLDITPTVTDELFTVAEHVRMSYDIDDATSYELDVIGRIVDQPRNFESVIEISYLSLGNIEANLGGLSSMLKPRISTVSRTVSDEIYKILTKSKIAKNTSDGTMEDLLSSITFITGVEIFSVTEGDMKFGINFGDALSEEARLLLNNFDLIPRNQGVGFLGYVEEPFITRLGRNQLKSPSTVMRNTQLTGAF